MSSLVRRIFTTPAVANMDKTAAEIAYQTAEMDAQFMVVQRAVNDCGGSYSVMGTSDGQAFKITIPSVNDPKRNRSASAMTVTSTTDACMIGYHLADAVGKLSIPQQNAAKTKLLRLWQADRILDQLKKTGGEAVFYFKADGDINYRVDVM